MRFGVVILPEHRRDATATLYRRAEELGFDHAWTYDHLAWRALRDSAWFAAVPTLLVAAGATTAIRLGTLVASPNFRHPVAFAREVLSLDDVADGRLTLGLGAGGKGWDATILGQAPLTGAERVDRFVEFVELLDRLLRQPVTDHSGRWYTAQDVRMHPGCVQQPRVPFAVAATTPRGMRLAASLGETWVTNGDRAHEGAPLPSATGVDVVRRQMAELDAACEAVGRDPATLRRLVLTGERLDSGLASRESFADTAGRYAEAGVTDLVVHWPRPDDPYRGDPAALEHVTGA